MNKSKNLSTDIKEFEGCTDYDRIAEALLEQGLDADHAGELIEELKEYNDSRLRVCHEYHEHDKKCCVQINVLNQLMLLKNSTFKDMLCFVDENIQNADRAGAKNVSIDINYGICGIDSITFYNDGAILNDFQKLFTIAESGWDSDVKSKQNPFGIGFWSNIAISNKLTIKSGNKYCELNISKMIEDRDVSINVKECDEYIEGFMLTLEDIQDDYRYSLGANIEKRAKDIALYSYNLSIFLNGKEQPTFNKEDIFRTNNKLSIKIDNKFGKGWIGLQKYCTNEIDVMYYGRKVATLPIYYAEGVIHLNDNALALRAPDRKDIIQDANYREFKSVIVKEVEDLANYFGTTELSREYSSAISFHGSMQTIAVNRDYTIYNTSDKKDISQIEGMLIRGADKKETVGSIDNDLSFVAGSSHFDSVKHSDSISIGSNECFSSCAGSVISGCTSLRAVPHKKTTNLFDSEKPVYWLESSELSKYSKQIRYLNNFKAIIAFATNDIEKQCLESLERSHKVYHIATLKNTIVVNSELRNTELSPIEKVANDILGRLCLSIGLSTNIFCIGDLHVARTIEHHGTGFSDVSDVHNVSMILADDKIFVDRQLFDMSMLSQKTDMYEATKLILTNIEDISGEIAIMLNKSRLEITNKIIKALL